MAVLISSVKTVEECRIIEQLQQDIWGCSDLEVAPDHLVLTIAKEGGVVLLARTEQGTPVGFGYGFLGLTSDGRLKLASHQVGVLPAYQDKGVGYRIKLAQREATLALGVNLITWTFDPLQGRNARFNLRKLGVVSRTYLPNLYGSMRDDLNRGLPTDRFRVDWWLASGHVRRRLSGQDVEPDLPEAGCPVLNPAVRLDSGLTAPPNTFALPQTGFCRVEIPADIQQLKTAAPELALQWRQHTRQIFEAVFSRGYTAVDFWRRGGRNYYVLQKDWQPE